MASKKSRTRTTVSADAPLPLVIGTDGIMETKLTRSEAIELMLQEASDRTERRIKEIEEEIHRLEDLTTKELALLIECGMISGVRIHHDIYNDNSTHGSFSVDYNKSPSWLISRRDRKEELQQERGQLYDVQRVLSDKGKAKLQIMKQVLEGSDQGREFLKKVEQMSVSLNDRLFTAAAMPKFLPEVSVITTVSVKATVKE